MENCLVGEPRHEVGKPEISENTEAANKIEKYNVPLNRLKMMFEKGEPTQTKILRAQSRSAGGRKISENNYSLDDLEIGPSQVSTPAFSLEKSETRRNLEIPRLSETSIKDRMAKYQAAVSKQSSSTNYTNELRANGSEIKMHKLEQKENVPPGPEVCVSHQDGEKVSATENSLAARSPATEADFRNSQVKSEIQQPVHPKPLSPDARASSVSESSPPKAVKGMKIPNKDTLKASHFSWKSFCFCSDVWSRRQGNCLIALSLKSGKFMTVLRKPEVKENNMIFFKVQVHKSVNG
ncbi:LIM domain and actin binding 1 [Phyllostomus discolor]|uniref:LIM domain and actin binding 1 n=1 Tax=Phyllostomus discolor TaxID=89673 RepID=A0A834EJG2_9CHIR|nr:LIM domain and actin binding 1 [Phyllostomus discolor]